LDEPERADIKDNSELTPHHPESSASRNPVLAQPG
jgi:hypothetical protein